MTAFENFQIAACGALAILAAARSAWVVERSVRDRLEAANEKLDLRLAEAQRREERLRLAELELERTRATLEATEARLREVREELAEERAKGALWSYLPAPLPPRTPSPVRFETF